MLQSLFRRAEASVDNAIATALEKAAVGLLFLVAAGFATAALSIYLNREIGPAAGNLVMAAAFLVLGLITAAVVMGRSRSSAEQTRADATASATGDGRDEPMIDVADKEVLSAAAKVVVPLALPALLRLAVRNLPVIAAVAAASFILSRNSEPPADVAPLQPAE